MNSLIFRDKDRFKLIHDAEKAKCQALLDAGEIEAVATEAQHSAAFEVQTRLHTLAAEVEEARKSVKEPVIKAGKEIDDAAKTFIDPVKAQHLRISALISDYHALIEARLRSEQAARNEMLSDLERQREEMLSRATTHEARDQIHQDFNDALNALPAVSAGPREDGQSVKSEIEFDVTDARALYLSFPNLVKLEPKRREIKDALKAGTKLPGVVAKEIIVASTRRTKEKVIDV